MASILHLFASLSLILSFVIQNLASLNSLTAASTRACSTLVSSLGSKVINSTSDPKEYDYSRTHYWSDLNKHNHPVCVVLAESAQDVQAAVKAVRKHGSRFAVKAGGHNTNQGGSSTTGVLIDLRSMNQKSFSADNHTATYQPGNRWGDIYKFLQDSGHGQQVVGGKLGDVGTGLSLGGGLSHLSPQYGMSCDGFLKLEVVLPNGELVTATGNNNYSDLFYFLKGSGNGAGIVTEYTVKTHDVGKTYYGNLIISADHEDAIHEAVVDFVKNAPPKAGIVVVRNTFLTRPLDSYFIIISYDGEDPGDAYALFDKIPHMSDNRKVGTYVDSTSVNDVGFYGLNELFRTGTFKATLESVNELVGTFKNFTLLNGLQYDIMSMDIQPVPASLVEQSRLNGGNSLESGDGPYFFVNALLTTSEGLLSDLNYDRLVERFEEEIFPPSAKGLPLFLNDAQFNQPVIQSYGGYEKIKEIKQKYDPTNFFSTHQTGPDYS